jgi:hypothetical protein
MRNEIRLIWSGAATTETPIKVRELKLTELKEEKGPKSKAKKKKPNRIINRTRVRRKGRSIGVTKADYQIIYPPYFPLVKK